MGADIFQPFASGAPPIPTRSEYPVPTSFVRRRTSPVSEVGASPLSTLDSTPLQTNKFHANLFLGSQSAAAWTQPYSVYWSKGRGNCQSWGMSISHIERDGLAYGPTNQYNACNYFFGPVGIQHMCLSAVELGSPTALYMDSLEQFSANANFCTNPNAPPIMSLPLIQGMGFVTAIYRGCTPQVQSSVFYRDFKYCGTINGNLTEKYNVTLEDGFTWLIYRTNQGAGSIQPMKKMSNSTIQGDPGFQGFIQVAKVPKGADSSKYDASAGAYATSCQLSAVEDGSSIRYSFTWTKAGLNQPLLMFALPHHTGSFDNNTRQATTTLKLWTVTKGQATAVLADSWTMLEPTFQNLGFAPYDINYGPITQISQEAQARVIWVAERESKQDVHGQCVLNSMYFSGKGLGKFAMIAYVLNDIVHRPDLVGQLLPKIKDALAVFINNGQPNPLAYEEAWRGVVSIAGLSGDPGQDFGNSFYNDHHFHYGYFVYTAAVIGYLDPQWLTNTKNKDWINMLVRDFANPVTDQHYPFSRAFDWYEGHSWAKGLFESADGKDQESSSEDGNASLALKMWAKVTGESNLEATADLRIAIQKRSFPKYFLMEKDNTCQPPNFIGNKAIGIAFNNKIDHATYFGANIEYIEGIHMVPCCPVSSIMRSAKFGTSLFPTPLLL
jgi:endo-1,3(4)-beta-glucanase